MNTEPLISVIIPCYNCERYVEEAIASITNQTYKKLEILIVDDCSTDSTFSILKRLASSDNRIKLYRHTVNKKLIYTLNEMIDMASGDYIVRMDADDISDKNRIEKQIAYMREHDDCSLCGTQAYIINEQGNIIGEKKLPHSHSDISRLLPYGNVIIHPSIMVKTSILKNNLFSYEFVHAEDYELWCRLIFDKQIKVHNLEFYGLKYRVSSGQISSVHVKEQVESSCKALVKYNLLNRDYVDLHANIFMNYGQTTSSPQTRIKEYSSYLYNEFSNITNKYAIDPMMNLLFYLKKNDKKLFLKYCLTPLGVQAIKYKVSEQRDEYGY